MADVRLTGEKNHKGKQGDACYQRNKEDNTDQDTS
jgi:hypothetical protein